MHRIIVHRNNAGKVDSTTLPNHSHFCDNVTFPITFTKKGVLFDIRSKKFLKKSSTALRALNDFVNLEQLAFLWRHSNFFWLHKDVRLCQI